METRIVVAKGSGVRGSRKETDVVVKGHEESLW